MTAITTYSPKGAPLPANYIDAVRALETCATIDECKEWRDRAAAAASYGKQKRDKSLFEYATRIKNRATRRYGEKIEEMRAASKRQLARIGSNPRGADESGPVWKLAERLRGIQRDFPELDVLTDAKQCSKEQRAALNHTLRPTFEMLDRVAQVLGL